MAELALGNPAQAERALKSARDRFEDIAGHGAGEWFASVLLDDRQLDYEGADYEHVLVRAMLAAANLMAGGGDATAYALQVLERQRQIMDAFEQNGARPKQRYKLVAFGAYLRAILAEGDPLKADVAKRAYQEVLELEPGFGAAEDALGRERHSAPGNGVVHVIALVGRGPLRVEAEEPCTAAVLAIAQVIWAIYRDRVTFPNIAAVKIPALAFHGDNPGEVVVEVDGGAAGATAAVTDVEATARAEFAAMRDWITARAALRRAFKIAVTEGVKETVNKPKRRGQEPDELTDLAISLGGLLWTSLEEADLRCWGLLPATFQVLRLELPAGEHEVALRAGRHGAAVGAPQTVRVLVRDGFNTYVLGLVPTLAGGPPPLSSETQLRSETTEPISAGPIPGPIPSPR